MTEGEEPPRFQTVCLSHVVNSTWSGSKDSSGPKSASEGGGAWRRLWSWSLLDLYGRNFRRTKLFVVHHGILQRRRIALLRRPSSLTPAATACFLSGDSDPSAASHFRVGHAVVNLMSSKCFTSKVLHLTSTSCQHHLSSQFDPLSCCQSPRKGQWPYGHCQTLNREGDRAASSRFAVECNFARLASRTGKNLRRY